MAEQTEIFNNEIRELEAKLEAKKRELAGVNPERLPERDVFRQVVREHAGSPTEITTAPTATPAPGTTSQPLKPEDERKLEHLIQIAFSKGIVAAVSEARKTDSPYFIDLLHDYLADQYYQKLLSARRLTEK